MPRILFLFCCSIIISFGATAQVTVSGRVTDRITGSSLDGAIVRNIYTATTVRVDSGGTFSLNADKGQLLEVSKEGFETARIRLPEGNMPSRYAIALKRAIPERIEAQDPRSRYSRDSVALYANYKRALALEKLTGIYAIYSPFSALSKRNRQIWRFQDEFYEFEREKFVDYVFSDTLVRRMTGLSGDTLARYKRYARPSYERARGMTDVELYAYIRESAKAWLKRQGIQRIGQ